MTEVNSTWRNRAELSIASGSLTNSKRPQSFIDGVYPTHFTRGAGCLVWDTEGKKYVDFLCGLGANIIGYGHTEVAQAISERAQNGVSLSLGTPLEVLTAEKVKELFPFVDRLRFLKTGSDVCSAAIRIARTFRGRGEVLSEGYHGWHDEYVSLTPPAFGVYSEHMITKLENLDQIEPDTAAVIVEPVSLDASPERITWLKKLRERCTQYGAVLIFDEVITGFRHPEFSASRFYGVTPDLICLGKAMGNGVPIAAVGGRQDIMECGEYFISSTFAGDTISLAAALKTMTLIQTKYDLKYLWERGGFFMQGFNSIWPKGIQMAGYPTRGTFQGDEQVIALFCQEACKAGLFFHPKTWFFTFPHLDVMDQVLNVCQDILTRIRAGGIALEGAMPKAPYASQVRSKTA